MNDENVSAPRTLTEEVYRKLRHDIINGRYAPGSKLRVEELRKNYDVGGGTCREALTLLLSDSLVTIFGQRGFRVADISYTDFVDITNNRILIEVEALRQSIVNGDEQWEAEVVASFHRLNKAEESLEKPTPEATAYWEERNRAFHHTLISASPSRWLKQFTSLLYQQSERYRRILIQSLGPNTSEGNDEWPRQKKEHNEIFKAVLQRDTERAAQLLTEHISYPIRDFEKLTKALEVTKSIHTTRSNGKPKP